MTSDNPPQGGDDDPMDPGGGDNVCEGPLGAPITDPSSLPACCVAEGGQAHCLGANNVPAEVQPFLSTCADGGYCMPDIFLATGGSVPPKTCTAFGGDGVCLSVCIPQVNENAALLDQDVCAAGELCAPCVSPLDMMETGACDLRTVMTCQGQGGGGGNPPPSTCDDPATCEYEASCPPVIPTDTLTSCAPDAHCFQRSLIEATAPTLVDQLAPCTDPAYLCVPDVFLETGGAYAPPACTSINDAEGRCMSRALPAVQQQEALLPQATCADTERCVPCFNPIDGADTGACALTCDMGPTEPPKPFANCCEDRGRCIPTAAVPEDQAENLSEQECEDVEEGAYLCVPEMFLTDEIIQTCEADNWLVGEYTGVCLTCIDFGIQGIAVSQGDCPDDYDCAPCINPTNGEPTGAPGCPGT